MTEAITWDAATAELSSLVPDKVVSQPAPGMSDEDLTRWRSSAIAGGLPVPALERWQALRAGVLNLWEFDEAEYWFAGGRAQFVGANQSGKSTLMALTTLIMLAGRLDRDLIDTFGEAHKAFRYYVEPTDDPTDRRDADQSTNRGWAWVEYGRIADGRPEYFTTLLYAQARRGDREMTPRWCIARGQCRVRDGISLRVGAASVEPKDLLEVAGFSVRKDGRDYRSMVSTALFGFTDSDRLDTVVKLLGVLRTPHLGRRLDPAFVTEQMRTALPAIEKSEIEDLAEGWDQLDKMAADRDFAQRAHDSLARYLKRAWNPWADAVLRRRADELNSAASQFDSVSRDLKAAADRLHQAEVRREELQTALDQSAREQDSVRAERDQLQKSAAYSDAQSATSAANFARDAARRARTLATERQREVLLLAEEVAHRRSTAERHEHELAAAEAELAAASTQSLQALSDAGLPDADAQVWVANADVARLRVALQERRAALAHARALFAARQKAEQLLAGASAQAERCKGEQVQRAEAAQQYAASAAALLQALSDGLEYWAQGMPAAPTGQQRTEWMSALAENLDQAAQGDAAPVAVLGGMIREQWYEPAVAPLNQEMLSQLNLADAERARACDAEHEARVLAEMAEPMPAAPQLWARRERPAPGRAGAPLWRLIDPMPGLDRSQLDCLEAALAASGMLEAWVSPDGVWSADRDGSDMVLSPTVGVGAGSRPCAGSRLSQVLRPAEDCAELEPVVTALLDQISYVAAGQALELDTLLSISGDGRWQSPLAGGLAAPAEIGATLIGAAVREAERNRRVAELGARAADHRIAAQRADARVAELRQEIAGMHRALDVAPSDGPVVAETIRMQQARKELERAERALVAATAALTAAELSGNDATAAHLEYCASHNFAAGEGLDSVGPKIDAAVYAVSNLQQAASARAAATSSREVALDELARSAEKHDQAREVWATADRAAAAAEQRADVAERSLGADVAVLLAQDAALEQRLLEMAARQERLGKDRVDAEGRLVQAQAAHEAAQVARSAAQQRREVALAAWWVPVDAGIAGMRGVPQDPARTLANGLSQARYAREHLSPANWPESVDAVIDKDHLVGQAWLRLTSGPMDELRTELESSGGRSAEIVSPADPQRLPEVLLRVDSTGEPLPVGPALERLAEQVAKLAALHDEKMQAVLVELLSSTFVEHLRDRIANVVALLSKVNRVLLRHPTGANATVLHLNRVPAKSHDRAFEVLRALERGSVESPVVQETVREFLQQQIREAQQQGRAEGSDWRAYLADQLDYRLWFDVITEYKVAGGGSWRALTSEVHAKDSGGGKVVTLVQPLLATLVALFDESASAPRPLWLDEAFTGVDATNRSTMLALLVEFDLDFLLAGPATMVAVAKVPTAAIWTISRAPAPFPGVDISASLWTGRQTLVAPMPEVLLDHTPTDAGEQAGLFDLASPT